MPGAEFLTAQYFDQYSNGWLEQKLIITYQRFRPAFINSKFHTAESHQSLVISTKGNTATVKFAAFHDGKII